MKAPRRPTHGSLQSVPARVRCGIYGRVSTDENLHLDFNSIDAQREAGESCVLSQKGEGWELIPTRYDDGGYTGANMERPGLKHLLADVEAGLLDCVVVYKIDRLSRSMRDFFKIFEIFEQHNVAFISVTQAFNTTSPVGRMTMNILLSFSQFEREQTAERTKDKVWAARRRGKFIGGFLPLGLDRHVDGGRLVVNEAEARQVQTAFHLFEKYGSLTEVVQELARRGILLKRWVTKEGREVGGGAIDVHALRRMLTNPVFIAEVHFDGGVYAAEHEPIVDRDTFNRVQELIAHDRKAPRRLSSAMPYLLRGLLRCAACDKTMTPSYSQKGNGLRYRYYVCQGAHSRGWKTCPSPSIPATRIEDFVVEKISAIGADPALVAATTEQARQQLAGEQRRLEAQVRRLAKDLDRAHADLRQRIGTVSGNATKTRAASGDDAIRSLEERLQQVREELMALNGRHLDTDDLRAALAHFTPVWKQLTTVEQTRIVQLLVERIDYHGGTGSLGITFRPAGVKMLAQENPS